MKCCCNRYTAGVTIGSLYIVGSVIIFIFGLVLFMQYDNVEDLKRRETLKSEAMGTIRLAVALAIISSLFIVAIVKRIHYLILLWLLLGIYIFYITCLYIHITFIGAAMGGAPGNTFIILLLISIFILALQIAIFSFSVALLMRIRIENIEKSERVEHQMSEKTLI